MSSLGILRPIRDDELELMLSWRNLPEVRSKMYTKHEISLEEHLAWWERVSKGDRDLYFFYEQDGKPYGVVGFNAIDKVNNRAAWAFYAAPNAPKGTGSKMEFLALEYAFNELGLNKLCCEVLAFNEPVIKLHNKFGFVEEGVYRQHHWIDDHYEDIYLLGMLATEWHEKRAPMKVKLERLLG